MAKGISPLKIIGFLLLIAGAALAAWGVYQLVQYNTSLFGKVSNKVVGVFNKLTGSGKIAKGLVRPLLLIVGGGAGAVFGFVLSRKS